MNNKIPVKIRDMEEDDIGFVYNTWLKSHRDGVPAKHITNDVYFAEHKKIIEKKLQLSNILMLCDKDDTSQLYGYIVVEQPTDTVNIIHYIYIKYNFRKFGLGKHLLLAAIPAIGTKPVFVSHRPITRSYGFTETKWGKLKEQYNLVYNPYAIHSN